jgi:circadian clock protein KaiC
LATTREELLTLVRQARAELVVIDGFRGLRGADAEPQRACEFLYDVGRSLSICGTTAIVTSEAEPPDPAFFPELTTVDVIIGLHYRLV